jgi:hypothetical protein
VRPAPLRWLAVPLALGLAAAPAAALAPEDVEAGARKAASGSKRHVKKLASNRMQGRDNDAPSARRARAYLRKRLARIGEPLGAGAAPYEQPFLRDGDAGVNLLATIRGRELPEEYVILGAHYDHLGVGHCDPGPRPGDEVCNGATDNAAGTAAVLSVGRALAKLPEPPRRSVVLALWDAEEDGLEGSEHYVEVEPLVPLAQTVAYVNLDILGATLIPSLADNTFAIGGETGGAALGDVLAAAAAAHPALDVTPLSYLFGQGRSDYFPFGQADVPVVFLGDSSSACYHTAGDELSRVDWAKLAEQSALAFRTVVGLAEADAPPGFVEPSPRPTFDDALSLQKLLQRAVPADLGLFPPGAQASIADVAALVDQIVADGPAAFDEEDAASIFTSAGVLIFYLEGLPCPAW